MRSLSLQSASVLFSKGLFCLDGKVCDSDVVRPQHEMREEPQWTMVSVVPSSLRSASLRLKHTHKNSSAAVSGIIQEQAEDRVLQAEDQRTSKRKLTETAHNGTCSNTMRASKPQKNNRQENSS